MDSESLLCDIYGIVATDDLTSNSRYNQYSCSIFIILRRTDERL